MLKDKLKARKLQRFRIFIAGTKNAPQEVGDKDRERFLNAQRGHIPRQRVFRESKILFEVVDMYEWKHRRWDSMKVFDTKSRRAEIFQEL